MSASGNQTPGRPVFSAASLLNPRASCPAKGGALPFSSAMKFDVLSSHPSLTRHSTMSSIMPPKRATSEPLTEAAGTSSPRSPKSECAANDHHIGTLKHTLKSMGSFQLKRDRSALTAEQAEPPSLVSSLDLSDRLSPETSMQLAAHHNSMDVETPNSNMVLADAALEAKPPARAEHREASYTLANGAQQSENNVSSTPRVASVPQQIDFVFTNGIESEVSDDQRGQSRLLEKAHGVTTREYQPAKKLKLDHQRDGNSPAPPSGDRGGVVGQWLQTKKREGSTTDGTATVVDLEAESSAAKPIDVDSLSEAKKSVVDLTGDNDVVEIAQKSEDDKLVCYGKVDGAQAYAHTVPRPKDHVGVTNDGSMWKVLQCNIFRERLGHIVIHLRDPHGQSFATVDTRVARALAPLIDNPALRLKIDARLDPRKRHQNDYIGKEVSEYWRLTLNLYGPRKHAQAVGKSLSQKNVWLATPYGVRYGTEIFNPHVADRAALSKAKWVQRAQSGGSTFVVRTNEEIAQDISGIFNSLSNTDDMPEAEPVDVVVTSLLRHQKQALHFMTSRETVGEDPVSGNPLWRSKMRPNGRKTYYNVVTGNEQPHPPAPVLGGIIADQMGLGKTLEAVAFICSTTHEAERWSRESEPVIAEDGTKLENVKSTLLICPKNVTSEWHDQISMHLKADALSTYFYHGTNRSQDTNFLRKHDMIITTYSIVANELRRGSRHNKRSIFSTTNWFRIVLDEAHAIREQSTQQSKAICALHASRRWALTGTPVQNRLEDLGALIKFLRIKPFDEPSAFVQYIMTSFKLKDQGALPKLRLLVDSFTLRRLKDKVNLPPRTEEIVKLEFSADEAALHNWFTKDAGNKMRLMQNRKRHLTGRSYQNVLRSILCLRLVSVHGRELLHEDDIQMISGISSEQPIDLDVDDTQPALTARAAYEMLMLMDSANRQVCIRCEKAVKPREEDDDDAVFGTMLPCYDVICNDCIKEVKKAIKDSAEGGCFKCPFCESLQKIDYFELTQMGVEEAEAEREQAKLNPRQAKILGRYKNPHTKTYALIEHLKANAAESEANSDEPPIKSVVFTEWTSHIDLIEIALEDLAPELKFVRFDGKMNVKQQQTALARFRTDPAITLIIVSIRAGGVGLNLTAASRVYVMEPQWNPAAEAQAVDRVHRLGQRRPVRIVRFIMHQSIEETMLKLQGKKKRMAEISMNRNLSRGQASVENMEEFKELFSRRL